MPAVDSWCQLAPAPPRHRSAVEIHREALVARSEFRLRRMLAKLLANLRRPLHDAADPTLHEYRMRGARAAERLRQRQRRQSPSSNDGNYDG